MRPLLRILCTGLLWTWVHSLAACTIDGVVFDGIQQGAATAPQRDDAGSSVVPGDAGPPVTEGDAASSSESDAAPPISPDPMWILKELPYTSGAGASAVLSDGLHYLGGSNDYLGETTRYQHHYVYDAASETWSDAPADIPDDQTWGARAHVYQDRLYLLGGFPKGELFRVYNPGTNAWTSLRAAPVTFEWGFASAVIGNALYAFGGEPGAGTNASGYKYDFGAGTWTAVAPLPENRGRGTLSSAAVGARIYVLNGNQNDGTTILQIYDSSTNTWSRGAGLSGHFFEAAATAVEGNKIYFFGGADDQDIADSSSAPAVVSSVVNIYDTATNTWSTHLPMGVPKMWATAELYNGEFHVLGGLDAQSQQIVSHEILRE